MTDDEADHSGNAYQAGQPDTAARTLAEAAIESLRVHGGVFVEAVRATRMPMVVTDPSLPGNPIVFANQAILELSGYSMDEILGQQPYFMTGRGTNAADAERLRVILAEDRDELVETVQYRKDGSRFVASVLLSAFKDAEGQTRNQFLSYLDITRRVVAEEQLDSSRKAEALLRDSEARLAAVLEQVPIGVGLFDADGRFTLMNPHLDDLMGNHIPSRDTVDGHRWEAIDAAGQRIAADDYPGARALRGIATAPTDFRRDEGGHERWVRVTAVPVKNGTAIDGGITVVQDVTEERRIQAEVRGLAERNSEVLESISDAFYAIDRDWRFSYVNRRAEEWWGRPRAALLGQTFWEAFPQSVGTALQEAHLRAAERREVVRIEAVSPVLGHWVEVSIYPAAEGGLSVYFRDISDRKLADERLRESERRFRTLAEGIPQLVWRAVGDGDWTWASPQWTAFTGQPDAASHDQGWLEPVHPDDRAAARAAWRRAATSGELHGDYRIRNAATGDYRFFQTRATPVHDEGGTLIEWLGTSTDVEDLRELQDRQGVLVAELQHRTRNVIAVIRSMADKTMRSADTLADFRDKFRDRLDAFARVQGLLSRLDDHDRVTFDELIRTELAALGALDGPDPRAELDGPDGVRLRSTTVQTLAMALHELATNAVKYGALRQPGGRLRVSWAFEPVDADGVPWLRIDWRESGVTMPEAGAAPCGTGQGRDLIERALPYQLKARTAYEMGTDGVRCTITIPVSASIRSGRHDR